MQKYVVGFLFNTTNRFVCLIRKNRPEWQAGKLNGVGGKVELLPTGKITHGTWYETPVQAMVREFEEETGVKTTENDWTLFAVTYGPTSDDNNKWEVYYFKASHGKLLNEVKTITDEQIMVVSTDELRFYNTVDHLQWLLPMALHGRDGAIYHIKE